MVNTYGPQTRGGGGQGDAGEQPRGSTARDCGNAAIEERIHNIETHLKLPSGQMTKTQKFYSYKIQCISMYVMFYTSERVSCHYRLHGLNYSNPFTIHRKCSLIRNYELRYYCKV